MEKDKRDNLLRIRQQLDKVIGTGESIAVQLPEGEALPVTLQMAEGTALPVSIAEGSTMPVELQLADGDTVPVNLVIADGASLPVMVNAESTVNVRVAEHNAPLSGEVLTVSAAGIVALTVPDQAQSCIITNPVDIRIAFGTDASATVGTLFVAKAGVVLTCRDQLVDASIYWTAAATGAYVQYFS